MTTDTQTAAPAKRKTYKLFLVCKPNKEDSALTTISVSWDDFEEMKRLNNGKPAAEISALAMRVSRDLQPSGQGSWAAQIRGKMFAILRGHYRPNYEAEQYAERNNQAWEQIV